ncbi:DNA cytosine methyltransferase [Fictibacillus aquaticus]|nr:DNA cytosine methyltransferase [Fictibacillus aquaticus]
MKAISLFSGAGGLDIASFMAGIPVAFSIDIEKDCIETLKINEEFHNTTAICGDLSEFSSEQIKGLSGLKENESFIVIGGAPCQPFSKNGYWVTNKIRRGINDPRADLVNQFLRVVTDLSPDGFVFENVESLLHPTNKVIVDSFIEIIQEAGYRYKIVRANSLNYGVPQKRKRLFIIGTKGNFKTEEPLITHGDSEDLLDSHLKPFVSVGEAISEFDNDMYFEKEELTVGGTYHEDLLEVPPGMNYKALTAWAGYPNPKFVADKRFWNFLLKLHPDRPSWTITAQPGPWVGPFHWNSRRLRVPEIAAIQTFPKGYHFFGNRRSIQKQIGNAVPPLMGKAMIEFLKESLDGLPVSKESECIGIK